MTFPRDIQAAAGSITGADHMRAGKNNQDAWAVARTPAALVAVVADGCGSVPHSEVGAHLGAELVSSLLARALAKQPVTDPEGVRQTLTAVQADVLAHLRLLAQGFMEPLPAVLGRYLLFTVVGALVTREFAAIFALGDGVIAWNQAVRTLGPFPGNEPPYLGYGLLAPEAAPRPFTLECWGRTDDLVSLAIGTDGVADLLAHTRTPLPGRNEPLGEISQFWTDDRYFANPDALRRRLAQANRSGPRPGAGLLADDTTLVVLRRPPTPCQEATAWTSM